jgi:putative SOS response-associated peptidase YedK
MFDRFILASNFKRITERFNMASLVDADEYKPSYNHSTNDKCYVITNYQTKEILQFEFGIKVLHNNQTESVMFVRAEGNRNINDDPNYKGSKAIFLQPEFMNIIRQQRCLVLADAFVVGIEKENPFLVYLRYKRRPFAFAGIWNNYFDADTNKEVTSFAVITVPANKLLHQLGYRRMPVILHQHYESSYIRTSTQLSEILSMLDPFPYNLMNAFPITNKIADKTINDFSLVQPTGKPVYNENVTYKKNPRLGVVERNHSDITFAEIAKRTRGN